MSPVVSVLVSTDLTLLGFRLQHAANSAGHIAADWDPVEKGSYEWRGDCNSGTTNP